MIVADAQEWRAWLHRNDAVSTGVWLMLAKKGTVDPTSLSYQEALEKALCSGWIDGQRKSLDTLTFVQRFTPRRPRPPRCRASWPRPLQATPSHRRRSRNSAEAIGTVRCIRS